MNKPLLGLCMFAISFPLFSQTEKEAKAFDSIFYDTAVNVSSANPTKAMHLADSLYSYSVNDSQRLKSIMLRADILEKQEKREEAIIEARKALEIAESSKNYSFQARIYGFLSTQYRNIGFVDKGKAMLEEGIKISSNIENKEQVTKYKAMAKQELADYAMEAKDYMEAIEYLNLAILDYENETNLNFKNFQIANCKEMLGRCYMALNEKEKAMEHFLLANDLIKISGAENTLWAALIYQSLGDMYLEKTHLDSAKVYLTKALTISDNGNHGTLKERVYNSMARYYEVRKELDSFAIYNAKHQEILYENRTNKRQMINSEFNKLNVPQETSSNNYFYLIIGFLVLAFTALVLYLKRKTLFDGSKSQTEADNNNSPTFMLPLTTEKDLLKRLDKFETSEEFLDKNMSFSVLVGSINTNAKYLSHIIKKHKNKDYNTYINELRINYIVDKLKTEPEYLTYKISYLAEESGFSSHSKFSADFKRVVHLSPSEFIDSLE